MGENKFSFQREKCSDVFDEALPLLHLHWKEVAHFKDIPLKPAFAFYAVLEDAGELRTFTARDSSDNALVGYAVFHVKKSPHYSDSLHAGQDVLFIHPERRGFGRQFIAWCDAQLQAEGVNVVYHHVKQAHNFGPLLERLGYNLVDLIYARKLN